MAFTLAEIITAARDALNDGSSAYFTDAELTRYIQQATVLISGSMKANEEWERRAVANGVNNYLAPESADIIEISHIQWEETQAGLVKIDPSKAGHTGSTVEDDMPARWYQWQDRFWIEPTPNSTADGKYLVLFYNVTTNDITQIPYFVQPLAITYAIMKAKLRDEKYAQAAHLHAMFMNELAFYRDDVFRRPSHSVTDLHIADGARAAR